ncbi:hypothetical protein [Actinorugispora endophytica]|uniref:Lipoprotein n=1 Tax=Actinorugispora endophytica TaxID=1605990 RepID=A0A4R6V3Y4_9ACTN|nr:hypothetical protein [Actinorugispora endophytica]TDQ54944.1 hypothetical protein EV190_101263 [Actinorugispora endophytica]
MSQDLRTRIAVPLAAGLLLLGATACFDQSEPSNTPSGTSSGAEDPGGIEGGVSGTFEGEVSYLAPGELIVNDQAFHVTEDTEVYAGYYACVPEGEPALTNDDPGYHECTPEEYEREIEQGVVSLATVIVEGGVAVDITEYSAEGQDTPQGGIEGGVSGTFSGEVIHLAPGELIVNDQAFYISEDTEVYAGYHACVPEGQPALTDDDPGYHECAPEEYEREIEQGVVSLATVIVENGVAVDITEYSD